MTIKTIMAVAGLAVAIGGFSAPSFAWPSGTSSRMTTADSRIESMMRRVDAFQHRQAVRDANRSYAERVNGRVAYNAPQSTYQANR